MRQRRREQSRQPAGASAFDRCKPWDGRGPSLVSRPPTVSLVLLGGVRIDDFVCTIRPLSWSHVATDQDGREYDQLRLRFVDHRVPLGLRARHRGRVGPPSASPAIWLDGARHTKTTTGYLSRSADERLTELGTGSPLFGLFDRHTRFSASPSVRFSPGE